MNFLAGAITEYIDVAQLALYVFWLFFAGLIYYLHRENKREGYPLVMGHGEKGRIEGFPGVPKPKTFILPHGAGTVSVPRPEVDTSAINARMTAPFPGAPIYPTGDPMASGVGPGAFAARTDKPDLMHDGHIRIVPMRIAGEFAINTSCPDPRGMEVVAGDGKVAGTIQDVWVDRSESIIRYYEVGVGGAGGKRVLLPVNFADVSRQRRQVGVNAIFAKHFAAVPALANADQITRREEDRICAYYGSGLLYAEPKRSESLL